MSFEHLLVALFRIPFLSAARQSEPASAPNTCAVVMLGHNTILAIWEGLANSEWAFATLKEETRIAAT